MPIISPQDQSTDDSQLVERVLNRRMRIKQAKQKIETEKVDIPLQAGPKNNEASVTIPINTWIEVIRLARLGQQSVQNEADGKKMTVPTQEGGIVRESDSYQHEQDGDTYKNRISATITALRKRR